MVGSTEQPDRPPFRVFHKQPLDRVRRVVVDPDGGLMVDVDGALSAFRAAPGEWSTIKLLAGDATTNPTGHTRAFVMVAYRRETPLDRAQRLVRDCRAIVARLREQITTDPFGAALDRLRARTPPRPE